jgi:flagellar hook-associated protein 3 FlgL
MVTRIATATQNEALVSRMLQQQNRVADLQTQLSTRLKSQDYLGISQDSFQLLNVENERSRLGRYISNNSLVETTLKTQLTSAEGIDDTARLIRSELLQFSSRDLTAQNPENTAAVQDLQNKVFNAFSQLQYFLSQQVGGKYIFGGAKSDQPPLSLPYNNLQEFQNFYDGVNTVFPASRVANLVDISFAGVTANYANMTIGTNPVTEVTAGAVDDFVTQTIDQTSTGNLIFSNVGANGRITSATPSAFNSLQVGQTILLNNSAVAQGGVGALDNNGVYTITAVSPDGNTITLDQNVNAGTEIAANGVEVKLAPPNGTALALSGSGAGNNGAYSITWPTNADLIAAGYNLNVAAPDIVTGDILFTDNQIPVTAGAEVITLQSQAFLTGTSIPTTQRISDTQSITLDVTGLDPAFEKMVRAFGIIAQGDLLNNQPRVEQALAVLNDAIEHSSLQPTEEKSDLRSVQDRIALNLQALDDAKNTQTQFRAFLEGRQNELEGADTTEAAIRLQTESQALEISFASLARITQLSLIDFI